MQRTNIQRRRSWTAGLLGTEGLSTNVSHESLGKRLAEVPPLTQYVRQDGEFVRALMVVIFSIAATRMVEILVELDDRLTSPWTSLNERRGSPLGLLQCKSNFSAGHAFYHYSVETCGFCKKRRRSIYSTERTGEAA